MNLQALRSVPLFQTLDSAEVAELFQLLTVRTIPERTALFRRDDPGDAMFFIESGRIRISVQDADGQDTVLAEMGSGDFFGEMAMLDGQNRSADATATEPTTLAVLAREDFRAFIRKKPDIALGLMTAMTHRLRRTDNLLRHRISRNINDLEAAHITHADRGAFDPFPYVLLNLVLGMVAGLQAPIIMMSQNRQGEKDRLRADLDYRVNLKNELLLTEVLRRLENLEGSRSQLLPADAAEGKVLRQD